MATGRGRRAAREASGRIRDRRRPGAAWIAPIGLPVLVTGLLLATSPGPARTEDSRAPSTRLVDSAELVCPSAPTAETRVVATRPSRALLDAAAGGNQGDAQGRADVELRSGDAATPWELSAGATGDRPIESAPVSITSRGEAAGGIVAVVESERKGAAGACSAPDSERWFAGLGAGPLHASVIELVNSGSSTAVADIVVYAETGVVDAPDLRGVAVAAGSTLEIKLAEVIPQRGPLAAQVRVPRGRLGVFVTDRADEPGSKNDGLEFVASQSRPASVGTILGLPPKADQIQLVVVNPGPEQALFDVKLVTETSTFVPTGLGELQAPPESTVLIALTDSVKPAAGVKAGNGQRAATRPLGVALESSRPLAASLRARTDTDEAFSTVSAPSEIAAQLSVPSLGAGTTATLLVAAAARVTGSSTDDQTPVTWRAVAADGEVLREDRLEVRDATVSAIQLPSKVASVEVVATTDAAEKPAGFIASVMLASDRKVVVLPLRELTRFQLVPDVEPRIR
ncbi:MAG: DUF5719 family protein [Nocardioides sp.]